MINKKLDSSEINKIVIRSANLEDAPSILSIYEYYVKKTFSTFETETPSKKEMNKRIKELKTKNMPILVATKNDVILGYAYVTAFRQRWGYRFAVEDSVFVDQNYLRLGIGKLLISNLINETKKAGFMQIIAVIGDSNNTASIEFHKKFWNLVTKIK